MFFWRALLKKRAWNTPLVDPTIPSSTAGTVPARVSRNFWSIDSAVLQENRRRSFILAVVVFILQLPLLGIDLFRLQAGILEVHAGYRYLFYLHVLLQVVLGVLLLCMVAARKRLAARKRSGPTGNALVLTGVVAVLAIAGSITLVDQLIHGQATVYLLGAVGVALIMYVPLFVSCLIFGGVSGAIILLLPYVQSDPDVLTGHIINIALVTAVAITANATLYRQAVRTARHLELIDSQRDELNRLASEDDLTGVANRRYGDRRLREELARYRRYNEPFSLCFCDLDHFKRVNDRFSHAVGDTILRRVAQLLLANLREEDVVMRYGGEEFVLLLPETRKEEATVACEKLRRTIAACDFSAEHADLEVTMSFGVADCSEADAVEEILRIADERLYDAKSLGRNRVECG